MVFVLLVFPILSNIFCFFIFDALLKKKYKVSLDRRYFTLENNDFIDESANLLKDEF